MAFHIVMVELMNLSHSAYHHAQLICLLVWMAQSAFLNLKSAMVIQLPVVVLITRTLLPASVTIVLPTTSFSCLYRGVNICANVKYKCDGLLHCNDVADELLSECASNCSSSTKFVCKFKGKEACLSKQRYQCNGDLESCDDGSDEAPSVCANCTMPGLHMCRDGSQCIKDERRCNGILDCVDGSDEADSWSNCTVCAQNDTVQCPGFPDNCAKVCDGDATCPD